MTYDTCISIGYFEKNIRFGRFSVEIGSMEDFIEETQSIYSELRVFTRLIKSLLGY